MIVITGPGRSGTSVLAAAYRAAGANVGGSYSEHVRAGYEDPELVALNGRILSLLGGSLLGIRRELPRVDDLKARAVLRPVRDRISPKSRDRIRRAQLRLPGTRMSKLALPEWNKLSLVQDVLGDEMRRFAAEHTVAKDPQFSLTLGAWIAAGASIDAVVATSRNIDEALQSRREAGHIGYRRDSDAMNSILLAIGALEVAMLDTPTLSVTRLRFPDFLSESPEDLASRLPLPREMTQAELVGGLAEVVVNAG